MAQLEIPWAQELFQTSGDFLLIMVTQPPSLPFAQKGSQLKRTCMEFFQISSWSKSNEYVLISGTFQEGA